MSTDQIRVCTNHGLPFEGPPVTFPVHVRTNGKMVLSPLAFCRLECAKTYLADHHPNLLDLFEKYAHEQHGVSCVPVLPSPVCLAHFQMNPGVGISIDDYFSKEVVMGDTQVSREMEFGNIVSQSVSEDSELKVERWGVLFEEHKQRAENDPELSSTLFKLDTSARKSLIDVKGFSVTEVPRQNRPASDPPPASSVMDFSVG
jgi:hypothetical protein